MQGQRGAVGSLPEVIGFDHGSTSGDTGFDQQVYWTTGGNSAQSRLPDYLLSSSDTSMGHMSGSNPSRQDFRGWDFGESSSRAGQAEVRENDLKTENEWTASMNICTGNVLIPEQQHQSSSSQGTNQPLLIHDLEFHQLQPDLNMNTEIDDGVDDDDDCQVLENLNVFSRSGGSRIEQTPVASTSSNPFGPPFGSGGYSVEETDGRPGCSLDGRRLSGKRKTLEANVGQPSEGGSTTNVQQAESRGWHTLPHGHNASSGNSALDSPEENSFSFSLPEQVNSRLELSFGQVATDNSPLSDASGTTPSSRRNFRWRINSSPQPGSAANSIFSPDTSTGNTSNQPHNPSRLHPPTNFSDLRSASAAGSGSAEGQPAAVHVSSLCTSSQPRWNGSYSLRHGTPPSLIGSGARNVAQHEASSSTSAPRSITDFPMFVPPYDPRSSPQTAPNWGLAGRNVDVSGNVAPTSRISSGAGVNPAASWVPRRSPSQYPRRLAEYVRRSLTTDSDSGGRNGIYLHPGPSSSQEVQPSSGSASQGRHSHSRSAMLLERRIDGALELPYSLQTLAGAIEGRSRLVSEMRNVLDLVRRGGGLRFEDVMILDQSVFFGMADLHDRHRDMRLDVDNMSYEELLALGERIGSVNTGLSEENISKQLKQQNYVSNKADEGEIEPCCICQEAYNEGEVLGSLECGHDFHADCIKQWLMQKNLCPICKTTGLTK